jgi:ribosomal-protein-alanine N-acetyltransferase
MSLTNCFEIVALSTESIPEVLRLAEEGGLSPWTEADYRSEIVRDASVALEIREKHEQKTTGFIIARLITNNSEFHPVEAEILNITIDRNYRNLGLASALLDHLIRIVAQQFPAKIWLEVRCSNAAAIAFYENKGFTVEYVRKNFYSGPTEDGFVMKLDIYG